MNSIEATKAGFISDPRPNDCDTTRFVDDYMQLKKDGHIKFYTKAEWKEICGRFNLNLIEAFDSQIRFTKKKRIMNMSAVSPSMFRKSGRIRSGLEPECAFSI